MEGIVFYILAMVFIVLSVLGFSSIAAPLWWPLINFIAGLVFLILAFERLN